MTALLRRSLTGINTFRRVISTSSIWKDKYMADPLEHATGLEKKELLARLSGNEDPFYMRVYRRGPGTKQNPNLVPCTGNKRLIGCVCEEESTCVLWMWLEAGEAKRCECGYWFKLESRKPL